MKDNLRLLEVVETILTFYYHRYDVGSYPDIEQTNGYTNKLHYRAEGAIALSKSVKTSPEDKVTLIQTYDYSRDKNIFQQEFLNLGLKIMKRFRVLQILLPTF